MKVYVITQGEYSDYRICGVALDVERAEAIKRHFNKNYGDANIEEYDTDDYADEKLCQHYQIEIDKNTEEATVWGIVYVGAGGGGRENSFRFDIDGNFIAYVYAKDQDHALKIAFDKRAKMLAEKMGL